FRALKQIGQTMYVPPASAYRRTRSASGGQPSQATAVATPARASRAASLVRNISVCRPCSAAPTATRNATVTFSVSSSPVVRLITALPIALARFLAAVRPGAARHTAEDGWRSLPPHGATAPSSRSDEVRHGYRMHPTHWPAAHRGCDD